MLISKTYQIYGNNGTITSPNFPGSYPNLISSRWNITAARGNQIKLNFTSFHLEPSKACEKDFVHIQDGPLASSDVTVRMCGQQRSGKTVFSIGPHLQLYLETDRDVSLSGFQVFYEAVSKYFSVRRF